jgi:glucan phosphoethanolaminetransferase (alkaline phosphatase superfamily)
LKAFKPVHFGSVALTGVKLLAVVLLLVAAPFAWANMFSALFGFFLAKGWLIYAMGYAVLFWACILALAIIPFLRNTFVRTVLVILIIISYAADRMYFDFTGLHFDLSSLWVIWFERGVGLTAFPSFASYFFRNYFWVVAAGIVMLLPPARNWGLRLRWSGVPLSILALISTVILYTKGGTQAFPPTFALPVMLEMVATTHNFMGSIAPANVDYSGPINPLAKHIVFIVDESVRGDVMEINDPKITNTPFLAQQKDNLINFGVAVAPSNCSFISRVILRLGLRPEDFRDGGLTRVKRPSIWKYAHEAGFRTIVLEGWGAGKNFYALEWPFIDQYLPETDAPAYLRDISIADKLIQFLKEDVPSFIYVNKFGTHLPYESSYPPDFNNTETTADLPPANRTLAYWRGATYAPNPGARDEMLRNYNNAILWNVDGFFRKLLHQFNPDNVLLVYTSDHGQSLMDGGQRKSHCTSPSENTQVGEGFVPLLVSTGIPGMEARLRKAAAYNRASGFDIFPTLLLAMGYNEQWVRARSGPSLLDVSPNRSRRFLRNNTVGDSSWFEKPSWFPVD